MREQHQRYTPEFRAEAVKLVTECGAPQKLNNVISFIFQQKGERNEREKKAVQFGI